MLYSIKGKVADIDTKSIIIATTDFDYQVLVARPQEFLKGEFIYLYLYHVVKEEFEYLVGFRSLEEKKTFKLLLNVQGIGPKSALSILANTSANELMVAISNKDFEFLQSIPGISERTASQIYLDLSAYLQRTNKINSETYQSVKSALKSLKFKVKDIDKVLPKIYMPNATRDDLLKEALRRLSANVNN